MQNAMSSADGEDGFHAGEKTAASPSARQRGLIARGQAVQVFFVVCGCALRRDGIRKQHRRNGGWSFQRPVADGEDLRGLRIHLDLDNSLGFTGTRARGGLSIRATREQLASGTARNHHQNQYQHK
jgi:hypothetical protein